ncbi:MAG: transcriptional regulator [Solibacillus sp.]
MTIYRQGYEVYVKKCEQFGLEPINFRYYVMQLSPKQLTEFNMIQQKSPIAPRGD